MKRKLVFLAVFAGLLALLPVPVWAGGWATITLDAWPENLVAGQEAKVGFTVRQHGREDALMSDLTPTVSIRNPETGESGVFDAAQEGAPGHYTAALVFPSAGVWEWSVEAFTMVQPMPELTVREAQGMPAEARARPNVYPLLAGGLGLALMAGAALLARRRTRLALVLVVVGLASAGVGLASAAAVTPGPPAPPATEPEKAAILGEALFVVKGCIQCHRNDRIDRSLVVFSTEMGPNLSQYKASEEYLWLWPKDPKEAKPQTLMPDLGLSKVEIEALIAFLKSGDG